MERKIIHLTKKEIRQIAGQRLVFSRLKTYIDSKRPNTHLVLLLAAVLSCPGVRKAAQWNKLYKLFLNEYNTTITGGITSAWQLPEQRIPVNNKTELYTAIATLKKEGVVDASFMELATAIKTIFALTGKAESICTMLKQV